MTTVRTAQSGSGLERQSSQRVIVSSNTAVDKTFMLQFPLSLRGSQLESANINEIKRDIHVHLAYTLFLLWNSMY